MPRKGDYKPKLNLIGQKFGRLTVLEYKTRNIISQVVCRME